MMIDISKMTYSEFCEYSSCGDGYDRFDCILDYKEFDVYKDKETGKYYYLEGGENDASDFFEVEVVATLNYSIVHDLLPDAKACGELMARLFSCTCCGEYVFDDGIQYLWFDRVRK